MTDLEARLGRDALAWQAAVDGNPRLAPDDTGNAITDVASVSDQRSAPRYSCSLLAAAAAVVVIAVASAGAWLIADHDGHRRATDVPQSCLNKLTANGVVDFQSKPAVLSVTLTNTGGHACQVRGEPPTVIVVDHDGNPVGRTLDREFGPDKISPPPVIVTVKSGQNLTFGITRFAICTHTAATYSLDVQLRLANSSQSRSIRIPAGTLGGRHDGCPAGASGGTGTVSYLRTQRN